MRSYENKLLPVCTLSKRGERELNMSFTLKVVTRSVCLRVVYRHAEWRPSLVAPSNVRERQEDMAVSQQDWRWRRCPRLNTDARRPGELSAPLAFKQGSNPTPRTLGRKRGLRGNESATCLREPVAIDFPEQKVAQTWPSNGPKPCTVTRSYTVSVGDLFLFVGAGDNTNCG